MAKIDIHDLSHSYLENPIQANDFVFKSLNLSWPDGRACALLGPSGCGKSTLLRIISGLTRATQGQIKFDGEDVTKLSAQQRHVAEVFQFPVVYETMSVFDNLAFPLKNRGVAKSAAKERVLSVAKLLGLTGQLGKKSAALPAAAKQLVSLGRGLVRTDVNAILFDEPLTVIDPQEKWQLRTRLKQLHREFEMTMIYVTHDQTEALTFADIVMVMRDGKILQTGTAAELFNRPTHKFVGQFIGSPGMNFIPCHVDRNDAVVDGVSLPLAKSCNADAVTDTIELGIRPEHVRLSTDRSDLGARLMRIENASRRRLAYFDVAGTTICVSIPRGVEIPSDGHHLRIDTDRALLYASDALLETRS